MYVLLVHVSGIPPLEAHMLRSRGDAFRPLSGAGECVLAGAAEVRSFDPSIRSRLMSLIAAATRFVERAPLPDGTFKIGSGGACRSGEPLPF